MSTSAAASLQDLQRKDVRQAGSDCKQCILYFGLRLHQAGCWGAQGHLSAISSSSASSIAFASMLASQAALVSAILASMSRFRLSIWIEHGVLKAVFVSISLLVHLM